MGEVERLRRIRDEIDEEFKNVPISEMVRRIREEVRADPRLGPLMRKTAAEGEGVSR